MCQMHPRHLDTTADGALHGGIDVSPCGAPTEHAAICIVDVADGDCRWDVVGDAGDLGGAQVDHPLMVLGRVADVAATVFFLQSADAVHQLRRARDGPRSSECLGVTEVRPELLAAVLVRMVERGGEM